MRAILILKNIAKTASIVALAMSLASCGGGGSNNACSDQKTITISGTGYPKTISAKVGVPIASYTPNVIGIPASCESEKRFVISLFKLPDGISLDPVTGTISGTPLKPSPTTSQLGQTFIIGDLFAVSLRLPGYADLAIGSVSVEVRP